MAPREKRARGRLHRCVQLSGTAGGRPLERLARGWIDDLERLLGRRAPSTDRLGKVLEKVLVRVVCMNGSCGLVVTFGGPATTILRCN